MIAWNFRDEIGRNYKIARMKCILTKTLGTKLANTRNTRDEKCIFSICWLSFPSNQAPSLNKCFLLHQTMAIAMNKWFLSGESWVNRLFHLGDVGIRIKKFKRLRIKYITLIKCEKIQVWGILKKNMKKKKQNHVDIIMVYGSI